MFYATNVVCRMFQKPTRLQKVLRVHRDESLVEFVRALQTLYDRADPSASDSDKVSRAIRQSHPQFHPYLRGRVFRSLDELAQAAHQIQADILAELRYRPPPPPEACLEPSCAWTGTTRQSMDEHGSRPVLPGRVPRALDPYTHGLGDGAQVRERGRQYQAPSRERYTSATSAPLRCFRCGSLGHFRRDCTRRVSNDNSGNEEMAAVWPPVVQPHARKTADATTPARPAGEPVDKCMARAVQPEPCARHRTVTWAGLRDVTILSLSLTLGILATMVSWICPPPTTMKNTPTSVNFEASHSFHANNIIKEHFTTTEKTASGRWCGLDHGPSHLPTSRPPSLLLAVPAPNACAQH
ncbi:hypothetical protein HPB47_025141 [Ixodes persulcatus]|uniref:Uncharacterized protein n=1 Tax=Ixodes persulcatus TaxID=34615 RepID=A0AC60Q2E2_IXOPE|nr:hypothetical protein HPB47_025141 [Ixodes persulcatus]